MTMTKLNRAERQARLRTQEEPVADTKPTPVSRDTLYAEAKDLGLRGISKLTRDQLAARIAEHKATVTPEPTTPAEKAKLGDERIAEAAANHVAHAGDPDAPKPEEDRDKRMGLAKTEQAALKAWQLGGMQGERPVTPNYDYVSALYLGAVKPKRTSTSKGGGTKRTPRGETGPRGVEAAAAKAACGGKREATVKISDADLRAYIARVHEEHPDSSRQDEREYAFWVERLALSGRFPRFWKEVVEGESTEVDETPVPEPTPEPTKATKRAPAKRAPAKTAGKREVTPIPKAGTGRKRK